MCKKMTRTKAKQAGFPRTNGSLDVTWLAAKGTPSKEYWGINANVFWKINYLSDALKNWPYEKHYFNQIELIDWGPTASQ